jgi:preprotein translocase subunit SecG
VQILTNTLWVLLAITSLLMIGLVLIHRGRGGGITDMFGGGLASGIQSSAVGERNLTRITWGVAVAWGLIVVLLGLISRFSAA